MATAGSHGSAGRFRSGLESEAVAVAYRGHQRAEASCVNLKRKKEMKALKAAVRREQTSSKHPNKDPQNTQQRS